MSYWKIDIKVALLWRDSYEKRSISIAIILMAVIFSGCSSTSANTNVDEQVPANGELDTEASEV